jgi:hypothetical protein
MPRYTVTVDDDHLESIDDVAARLRSAGADIEFVHAELGLITASTDTMSSLEIAAVEGVASVTEDVGYQLPPPESPIQ